MKLIKVIIKCVFFIALVQNSVAEIFIEKLPSTNVTGKFVSSDNTLCSHIAIDLLKNYASIFDTYDRLGFGLFNNDKIHVETFLLITPWETHRTTHGINQVSAKQEYEVVFHVELSKEHKEFIDFYNFNFKDQKSVRIVAAMSGENTCDNLKMLKLYEVVPTTKKK